MHFISGLIVLSLGFSHCFVFFKHLGVFELKKHVSKINSDARVTAEWIEQPIDHFDANKKTWRMRYFKRLDLWKPNGPIYLYINGESRAESYWIQEDSVLVGQLAAETNGALFASEHRYYGESMPVDITDTSSMKYLSSKQALSDLAELIKLIKSAPEFKSSKVVVIGGSYAGNLAAWMRALYPELVDAAVSSSAPVLAKNDFYEYFETVGDTYEKYGSTDCLNRIKTIFNNFAEELKTSDGIEKLKKELNICAATDLSVDENQQFLFALIMTSFAINSQNRVPGEIKSHCDSLGTKDWAQVMQRELENALQEFTYQYRSSSVVKHLFQLNNWIGLKPSSHLSCYDVNFSASIEQLKQSKGDSEYSWCYQTCTEFGYYQTGTSNKQPFTHNLRLDFYIKTCQGVYGEDFNEKRVDDGIAQTNAMYGGLTPNVTNVVFTHGDMDPWHRLGVVKDLSDTVVTRITNGTSHCAVLLSPNDSDPKALSVDRDYVKSMIKKWIK